METECLRVTHSQNWRRFSKLRRTGIWPHEWNHEKWHSTCSRLTSLWSFGGSILPDNSRRLRLWLILQPLSISCGSHRNKASTFCTQEPGHAIWAAPSKQWEVLRLHRGPWWPGRSCAWGPGLAPDWRAVAEPWMCLRVRGEVRGGEVLSGNALVTLVEEFRVGVSQCPFSWTWGNVALSSSLPVHHHLLSYHWKWLWHFPRPVKFTSSWRTCEHNPPLVKKTVMAGRVWDFPTQTLDWHQALSEPVAQKPATALGSILSNTQAACPSSTAGGSPQSCWDWLLHRSMRVGMALRPLPATGLPTTAWMCTSGWSLLSTGDVVVSLPGWACTQPHWSGGCTETSWTCLSSPYSQGWGRHTAVFSAWQLVS